MVPHRRLSGGDAELGFVEGDFYMLAGFIKGGDGGGDGGRSIADLHFGFDGFAGIGDGYPVDPADGAIGTGGAIASIHNHPVHHRI